MPRFFCLAGLLAPVLLAACDGPAHRVFGDPVPVEFGATGQVTGPRLTTGPDARLTLSWMETVGDVTELRYATLEEDGPGAPAIVVAASDLFVNWADLPSVTHVANGHWIAHWLRYSADKRYSYDVVVAQSFDGGKTWGDAVPAHTDGTATEHGFVSMHRVPDGVALLWLDGRNTPDRPMTLRSAVITPAGGIEAEQLVDDAVCDCCQTDVAVAASGPVAAYRDRTDDEIRDIYVTRHLDDAWQPGVRLFADDWEIAGCPVNGPAIVAREDHVAIAWFSAAGNAPIVRLVISDDSGATFGEPLEIASGRLAGFVGLALLPDGSFAVSWVAREPDAGNVINLRHVAPDGTPGTMHRIAESQQLRLFPQLGYQGGNVYLIWTDEEAARRSMKAVRIPVAMP
jgi:hypothetical protein